MSDLALSVRAAVRRFGSVTAVDELSFDVPRASITVLLGPNGAGKTTTIEMCEGFAKPDDGEIRVLDLDPWRDSDRLRPRVGVMLQSGGAQAGARTGEMLDLLARCSANPLDPGWLLDVLGLSEVARTPVRRISGGQLQRLSLAMALVGRPELLFLDEPSAGLDPQARRLIWDLLTAARRDGATILLTTHLLDEVELLADQVVIVDHGRRVALGTPAELTAGATGTLRFTAPPGLDLDRLRSGLPDGFEVAEVRPGGYLVSGPITPDTATAVMSFCADSGVLAADLQTGRSLEEVYLELTGRSVR